MHQRMIICLINLRFIEEFWAEEFENVLAKAWTISKAYVLNLVENIEVKEEVAHTEQFLFMLQCFNSRKLQNASTL